ncbi:MAG TPA: DUF5680 domain-containing protein [Candidatus Gracilibacteria bacterium]|nr:DUF5680 domain-containing protein [Candidatus Gracilibacteria bacterium]
MLNFSALKSFLLKAKVATYASGESAIKQKEKDGSTTLTFTQGDFLYHDNYFGGEPYGGREVVFYQGKPLYLMTYYGWVNQNPQPVQEIYEVLQAALRAMPADYPYRGPQLLVQGDYEYHNNWQGEVDNFQGSEFITYHGQEVYCAQYMGGLVDQKF